MRGKINGLLENHPALWAPLLGKEGSLINWCMNHLLRSAPRHFCVIGHGLTWTNTDKHGPRTTDKHGQTRTTDKHGPRTNTDHGLRTTDSKIRHFVEFINQFIPSFRLCENLFPYFSVIPQLVQIFQFFFLLLNPGIIFQIMNSFLVKVI